jgi:hypothetical protein
MEVCPDITLTRLFMVMKSLVNYKVVDLEVSRSIREGSTIFSTIKQRLNNAPSFSAGGIFCVFWPIYPDIYPDIYSYDCQIMLDKNNKSDYIHRCRGGF